VVRADEEVSNHCIQPNIPTKQRLTRDFQNEKGVFQKMCLLLIEEPVDGNPSHEERLDVLRCQFPWARKWINWWTMADVKALLFPARRPLLKDSPGANDGLPATTNAHESMHQLYYMIRYMLTSQYIEEI
jgi:hypothetical protein